MSAPVEAGTRVRGVGRYRGRQGVVTGVLQYPWDQPVRYLVQWGLDASVECQRSDFQVPRSKR